MNVFEIEGLKLVDAEDVARACYKADEAGLDEVREYLDGLAVRRTLTAYGQDGQVLEHVGDEYCIDLAQLNNYIAGRGDSIAFAISQVI